MPLLCRAQLQLVAASQLAGHAWQTAQLSTSRYCCEPTGYWAMQLSMHTVSPLAQVSRQAANSRQSVLLLQMLSSVRQTDMVAQLTQSVQS